MVIRRNGGKLGLASKSPRIHSMVATDRDMEWRN
jgi:hypothetical protein